MKITKRQLRRIIKEAMHAPGGSDSSEDIMKKLNQLGWTEELRDAVGDVKGAGGYLGPTDADEEEYDLLMSNPEVAALVKAYAVARQAEHENY